MVRARMCELLAPLVGLADRSFDLFLVGMLSLIDALLDRKMSELLPDFPVGDDVKMALLGSENRLRSPLEVVLAYERGDFERAVGFLPAASTASLVRVGECYSEAVGWADQIFNATAS